MKLLLHAHLETGSGSLCTHGPERSLETEAGLHLPRCFASQLKAFIINLCTLLLCASLAPQDLGIRPSGWLEL